MNEAHQCRECGRDTRTYSPLEFELFQAQRKGAHKALKAVSEMIAHSRWPFTRVKKLSEEISVYSEMYK